MSKEINDFKQSIKTIEGKHKSEVTKITQERDELIKQITKIEHKETQYKHEIKNRDLQMSQLREQLKQKLESKKGAGKENEGPNMGM